MLKVNKNNSIKKGSRLARPLLLNFWLVCWRFLVNQKMGSALIGVCYVGVGLILLQAVEWQALDKHHKEFSTTS